MYISVHVECICVCICMLVCIHINVCMYLYMGLIYIYRAYIDTGQVKVRSMYNAGWNDRMERLTRRYTLYTHGCVWAYVCRNTCIYTHTCVCVCLYVRILYTLRLRRISPKRRTNEEMRCGAEIAGLRQEFMGKNKYISILSNLI